MSQYRPSAVVLCVVKSLREKRKVTAKAGRQMILVSNPFITNSK